MATDTTMRAESSILELVEAAVGVAIAAPLREIADSRLPAASCTDRSMVLGSHGDGVFSIAKRKF